MHQYCCTYTRSRSQKLHFVLGRKSRWMPHFKSCNRELEGRNKRDGLNRGIKHAINQSASFLHSRPGEQFDSVGAQRRSRAGVAHKSPSAFTAKPRWHCRCPYCRSSVVLVRIHLSVGAVRVRFRSVTCTKKQTGNNKSYRDVLYWMFFKPKSFSKE